MRVYPVKGGEGLRDPRTKRRIPSTGLEVPENNFWLRRMAHGDVTTEKPAEPEKPETDDENSDEQLPALPAPESEADPSNPAPSIIRP